MLHMRTSAFDSKWCDSVHGQSVRAKFPGPGAGAMMPFDVFVFALFGRGWAKPFLKVSIARIRKRMSKQPLPLQVCLLLLARCFRRSRIRILRLSY